MGAVLSGLAKTAPNSQLPLLLITSHGEKPPLNPPPQLQFDIRSLKTPPRHICDTHNGMSKCLQDWANADPGFISCRDAIRLEIQLAAKVTLDGYKKNVLKPYSKSAGVDKDTLCQRAFMGEATPRTDDKETTPDTDKGGDGYALSHELPESTSSFRPSEPGLRVGINCLIGRHRSVAMAEALANMPWPGWEVQVEHRDVWKKCRKSKKTDKRRDRRSRQDENNVRFEEGMG
ncbi:uncharacterized protein BP5553_04526 [Venustampulla echinocandica]|uniref:RapZ C-terminal domain-containing protein n=1 Tax=Venustampulla echinocandica TaxID=2656787 RepID=A0A370TNI8_9HELO|nr:uncharacterized protein BP5553_04526 [Venustampulla echinocandica]RDL37093.1 hypothetical protein BP5553_04526 [Venustampulla echinocandica]